jgi:hypothetical protein
MGECQQGQRFQEFQHWGGALHLPHAKGTYYTNLLSDSLQNRGFLIYFPSPFVHLLHCIIKVAWNSM